MKMLALSKRTAKEILRDPLNLFFGLGFPLVLIILLSTIQANIPVPLFEIGTLTPGITVFGLSFMSLFASVLVAKDRESAFLSRLYTTPLKGMDFIMAYMVPLLPISILQSIIAYLFSIPFGLKLSFSVVKALVGIIPVSLFFISLGVLCGSILSSKAVGGICGALLTNLSAWLSGIWFDISLVGGVFKRIADLLPFVHAVEMERALFSGNTEGLITHLLVIVGYTVAITILAIVLFLRQMRNK
ncbi:MAG: ABC transporter permease [Candidatus Ornithospirochaeta sp.]|nr:ABC transporter permease [Sphaerochaetaceae bacterium]MDY5523800.1 ABC transporter permease [Candidatus Ornithospirochaeta sp.]